MITLYGVLVRTEDGHQSLCSFDGSENYETNSSKVAAKELLADRRSFLPNYEFHLVQITVLEE